IDFVDEDDARRVGLALLEHVADARRAHADEHFYEIRTGHREEWPPRFAGHCAREQRLARARGSDEQRALRQPPAKLREFLRITQEFDDLLQLLLRFVGARDIGTGRLRRVARAQRRLGLAEWE